MTLNPTQTAHYRRPGVMTLFATLIVVTMLAIPASAEEIFFDPGVAPNDVNDFAISPDGTQVVFVGSLGADAADQTYVAGVLGGGFANPATRVNPEGVGANGGGVEWMPDGLRVTARYGGSQIYLVPANGDANTGVAPAQQLTGAFPGNNAYDPQISGDGNSLFYSLGSDLFVTPIVGASLTSSIQLNPGDISEIDTGSYAQVGSDILFAGFATPTPMAVNNTAENTFYRTAADGSTANSPTLIPVDNFPDPVTEFVGDIDFTQVTPDGQTIVFRGDLQTDNVDELFGLGIAGGNATPLITGPALRGNFDVNYFKISPDGSTIAFTSDYNTNGVAELFVIPVSGGVPRLISDSAHFNQTNGFDIDFGGVDRLQFSPDSNFVYFNTDDGDNSRFRLHRVAVNAIPEPTTLLPLLFAAASMGLRRKR